MHFEEQFGGDPKAFRELYRHYFPKVYGYVAFRIPQQQDAEDVVADIFVKVLEGAFEYRGQGSLAAWIFRIAHNTVQSFYRQRKYAVLPLEDDLAGDVEATPDKAMLQRERDEELYRQIRALSERRQAVITLKFFGGLRNQDIAEVLKLDERTVASHLCRGLDDLRQKYPVKGM